MKLSGMKYRAYAVGVSLVAHTILLIIAGLVFFGSETKTTPEYVAIEIAHREEQSPVTAHIVKKPDAKKQHAQEEKPSPSNVHFPPPPADVPVVRPDEPVAISELEMIDRAFFGDSLYTVIKAAPHLRPLVLRQMLVEHVPTTDTLETLRKQLAEAMLPYINMSDVERQARFHIKLFGTPTNPMRPGPIPGNIPISDILRALIELLK